MTLQAGHTYRGGDGAGQAAHLDCAAQSISMLAGNRLLLRQAPALLPAMRSRSQLVVAMAKKQGKKEAGGAQRSQAAGILHIGLNQALAAAAACRLL